MVMASPYEMKLENGLEAILGISNII